MSLHTMTQASDTINPATRAAILDADSEARPVRLRRAQLPRNTPVGKLSAPLMEPSRAPHAGAVRILDLGWAHCREIVAGDGVNAWYCGAPRTTSSYCAAHHQINYYRPRKGVSE